MRGILVGLLVAACGGPASPPKAAQVAPPVVAPSPPPLPPCIAAPEADGHVTRASATDSGVQFCVGTDAPRCYAYDLATSALSLLEQPPAEPSSGARVRTTNPELAVCTGESECVSLTPKVLAGVAPLHATTNETGTHAVVLHGNAPAGKGVVEIWDVAKTKKVASFKYARGEFRCGEVAMAGETIYVSAKTCDAPGARAALYTLRGKKLGNVGGRADFGTFGNAFVQIEGPTWAFLEESGTRVAIQDVTRGKVMKTIDTSALWTPDGQKSKTAFGTPGESSLVRLGNGKVAVIAGSPATGKNAIVDVTTGDVQLVQAPLCGSASA